MSSWKNIVDGFNILIWAVCYHSFPLYQCWIKIFWRCRFDIVVQVWITSWCFIAGHVTAAVHTAYSISLSQPVDWVLEEPRPSSGLSVLPSSWDKGLESLKIPGYRNTNWNNPTQPYMGEIHLIVCFRSSATKPSELPHCILPTEAFLGGILKD